MKHSNLWNELEMSKPDTSWVGTLVGVVALIAVAFTIFTVMSLIS